jgi:hypothetical protein
MVEPRDRRIPIMFSDDELDEIDEWRHNNRIATRADAVRRLCKIALFVDENLEHVVDMTGDGVDVLMGHSSELHEVFRLLINRETYGMTFDRDQLWDLFTLAREQADDAEEGVRGLHTFLVTMYNSVAALIDARSMKSGLRKSQKVVEDANAAFEQATKRKAERDAMSEENRYLGLVFTNEDANQRAAYEAMPEELKDSYLEERIAALKDEEQADPAAFAARYKIDERKFWEKPEWLELLDKRHEERRGEGR